MADEIPMIPKASTLIVHSGNIVNWNRLRRKPNQTPTEEVSECVSATLKTFLDEADKTDLQYLTDLDCVQAKYRETVLPQERGDLKLSVKIFLCNLQRVGAECIVEAIDKVLAEVDTTFLETALLSFPEGERSKGETTLEDIKPYWLILEELVEKEKVLSLGIADLDKDMLEQLYEWAKIKPVVNQVNLASCCVMPADLVEFAKEKDIQLLTHNDPRTLLPGERLQEVIRGVSTEKDGEGWEPLWVSRYSVLIKCRGIIKTKGYIVKSKKDMKRKK